MRSASKRPGGFAKLAALAVLLSPLHLGCDETVRTNVENGLIDTTTAAFGSFLTAVLEIATEQLAANATAQ